MGRSKADRELAAERRARAWELYCQSVPQNRIAVELGIGESATSKLIQQAAAIAVRALPQNGEQLAAELYARWGAAERSIREEIDRQRAEGRVTTTVTTMADGSQRVEHQHTAGVDPGLLRCLSTHADRRARQAMNQAAVVDAGGGAEQLQAVRIFLQQPMDGASFEAARWCGSMTAEQWNSQQDALPGAGR